MGVSGDLVLLQRMREFLDTNTDFQRMHLTLSPLLINWQPKGLTHPSSVFAGSVALAGEIVIGTQIEFACFSRARERSIEPNQVHARCHQNLIATLCSNTACVSALGFGVSVARPNHVCSGHQQLLHSPLRLLDLGWHVIHTMVSESWTLGA